MRTALLSLCSLILAACAGGGSPPVEKDGQPPREQGTTDQRVADAVRPDGPPVDGPQITPDSGPAGTRVNYRSIGKTSGALYATGTATITLADPTRVTFGGGASLPSKVGRGDKLLIGTSSTPDVFYVLSRDSATRLTLQTAATQAHSGAAFGLYRAYTSLAGWESARDGNLVAADRVEVGICYDDATLDQGVVIDGSTTDATHYMQLTVADQARHKGLAGAGVVLQPSKVKGHAIAIKDDHTRVEGLEITDWCAVCSSCSNDAINIQAQSVLIEGLLIHDDGHGSADTNSDCNGVTMELGGGSATVRNSVVYGVARAGITIHNVTNARLTVQSCTLFSCVEQDSAASGYGCLNLYGATGGTILAEDVIAVGSQGGSDFMTHNGGAFDTASRNNLSSDGSAPGSGAVTLVKAADLFSSVTAGAEDLHLKSGSKAVGAGANLSSKFAVDIDGDKRPQSGAWEIGADELP